MTEQSPPRRRREDFDEFELPPVERRAGRKPSGRRGARSREFFERFRKPLLGLGIAGAALPLIQESAEQAAGKTSEPEAPSPGEMPVTTGDIEEDIALRIGEDRANRGRDDLVNYAVGKYGITEALASAIFDNAVAANIDPKLAYGLVKTESSFKPRATSHVGARGLTQVMPRTARWLQPGTKADQLYDQETNLRLGFKYLRQLIDKYEGDTKLALLAYNRGPGTVDKVLRQGGDPDNGYARKVMEG